jgi:hypothetical protein
MPTVDVPLTLSPKDSRLSYVEKRVYPSCNPSWFAALEVREEEEEGGGGGDG